MDHALSSRSRERGSLRIAKRGRRATSDGRISESDRETRTRRVRVRERSDGGQRARQPRAGKIGVRCTLANTVVALQSAAALPPGSTATNPNRLVRQQRSIDSHRKPSPSVWVRKQLLFSLSFLFFLIFFVLRFLDETLSVFLIRDRARNISPSNWSVRFWYFRFYRSREKTNLMQTNFRFFRPTVTSCRAAS